MIDGFTKLPFAWSWISFEEITINYDGQRVPVSSSDRRPGTFPYYGASGIIDYVDEYLFDGHYLLIAEDGANLLSRSTPIAFEADGKFWVNNHAHIVQVPGNTIPLSYLREYINSTDLRFYISGSAQPKLNQKNLNRIKIPLPPLNEQRRIVAKIEALKARSQQVKEALEAIPFLLDQFRQSVLAAAFRGDLTADWREKNPDVEPASVLLERSCAERRYRWEQAELEKMKANGKTPTDDKWKSRYKRTAAPDLSELPDLPKGWCWATFEQVSKRVTVGHVGSMKDEYINNGIPFLRSQNVRENRFDPEGLQFISRKFHEYLRKSSLQPGDLVVVRSGSVGVACVIPETLKEANCSDLIIVKQPQAINPHYGAFYMNSIARSHVNAKQVGVALNHFNTKSMADLPIAVPPLAEQKEILRHIQNLFKSAEQIEQNYQEAKAYLDQLDQSILAKAFRGELVPQDPSDEPASILLERIRTERDKQETVAKTAKKSTTKTSGKRRRKTQQQDSESVQLGLPGLE